MTHILSVDLLNVDLVPIVGGRHLFTVVRTVPTIRISAEELRHEFSVTVIDGYDRGWIKLRQAWNHPTIAQTIAIRREMVWDEDLGGSRWKIIEVSQL